jgi:hypothetical protein
MPAKIGTDDILFRVGSGTPSKVFRGTASIQNVPGKPVVTYAQTGEDVQFTPPADGGSPILYYEVYLNGTLEVPDAQPVATGVLEPYGDEGDDLEIAAVNAVGEGPKSDSVIVAP